MNGARQLVLLSVGCALAACGIPPGVSPGASPLDRRATAQPAPETISPAWLTSTAQAAAKALQARGLVSDAAREAGIVAILDRLSRAAVLIDSRWAGWRPTVALIAGDSPDAWCMPEGRCILTDSMAAAGDESIATVLAHELAHLLRDHWRERLVLARPGVSPTRAERAASLDFPLDAVAIEGLLARPHHRVHEVEADRLAVELMARAGFDPYAALRFWRAGSGKGGSIGTGFAARHPSPPSRLRDIGFYAERMKPFSEAVDR